MRRYALLATLGLCAAAAGAGPVDRPSDWGRPYNLVVPGKGSLRAVDGRVLVVHLGPKVDPKGPQAKGLRRPEVSTMWRVGRPTGKGRTIRAQTSDGYRGWYLGADPRRKAEPVFLSEKPVAGSYWQIPLPDLPSYTTWLGVGPLSLAVENKGEKLLYRRRVCTGYPLKLVREGEEFEVTATTP